jgi:opacity protein-like surface antigen
MSKTKVLMVLLTLIAAQAVMFADVRQNIDRLEFGVSAGVGFYVGQDVPVAGTGLERVQSYDAVAFGEKNTLRWPGIETFGFNVGYRFDSRWTLVAKTVRQRVCFAEYDNNAMNAMGTPIPVEKTRGVYYNAMWHVDVMAEYNILNYGTRFHRPKSSRWLRSRAYPITPFVFFGVGVAISNKYAPVRGKGVPVHEWTPEDLDKMYTMIGPSNLAANFYLPVGVGVKWRMAYNWQLKAACQYNLGIGKDPSGGTVATKAGDEIWTSYDDLRIGVWNNVVLNLGVIYSFGERKRMLVNY